MTDMQESFKQGAEALMQMALATGKLTEVAALAPKVIREPGGREFVKKAIVDLQALNRPLKQSSRDMDKAIATMQKALRKHSWGIPL